MKKDGSKKRTFGNNERRMTLQLLRRQRLRLERLLDRVRQLERLLLRHIPMHQALNMQPREKLLDVLLKVGRGDFLERGEFLRDGPGEVLDEDAAVETDVLVGLFEAEVFVNAAELCNFTRSVTVSRYSRVRGRRKTGEGKTHLIDDNRKPLLINLILPHPLRHSFHQHSHLIIVPINSQQYPIPGLIERVRESGEFGVVSVFDEGIPD
jgi:hypothetical protein